MNSINIIGAGLAGIEAAWQIANRGIKVKLYEMKPGKKSPAHLLDTFGELVCSNSLRADRLENAVGLLKQEMRELNSLIMEAADKTKVPAGGALAVDRILFSQYLTAKISSHEFIEVINKEVTSIPKDEKTIIATGPLTSEKLYDEIKKLIGFDYLSFYDAAAPIVLASSIDMSKAFFASRYDKGGNDYLNCPMNEEEYMTFYNALVGAEVIELKSFEKREVFEGCLPVEVIAKRGIKTLLFGPLKPVGLTDKRTLNRSYAVVQLRKENIEGTMFNLVGFQTNLKHKEQKRVFSLIPGLEKAEYVRLGVMHRNTFLNSPKILDERYRLRENNNIYFAGQITGVEGYIESASSGLLAGLYASADILDKEVEPLDDTCAIGALSQYVSKSFTNNFQPMNVNFAIIKALDNRIREKKLRNLAISERALKYINNIKSNFAFVEEQNV
jgi:methylenetetrahydrofolate--tRNA-(uracil-5-)-methyltransferase